MPIYGENYRVLRSNKKRNWKNGNRYDEIPETSFINGRQNATQPMKKRLIDQDKTDVISVNHGNHDDFPREKEVSNNDNSSNHPDEASINNFSIDEEEDDETMLILVVYQNQALIQGVEALTS